ncbi:MAG: aldo/keto reductase [Gemmatimonadota bacterium]|nr:MAG: aldo/keto reductase [Gemmatimonadota bacterium]
MPVVELGRSGRRVSRIGLGGMWLSIEGRPDRRQAERVIRRAVELGVTFIDTADVYCLDDDDLNHNERLIGETLAALGAESTVLTATKGGLRRPGGRWETDARPDRLREAALRSREALRLDRIVLYQLHAPDPRAPFESSVEALAGLQRDGVVELVGLSNVDLGQLQAAEAIVEITSVQNRYNPWDRAAEGSGLIDYCEERRITLIPYSPLGGARRVQLLQAHEPLRRVAARVGASPAELVLGWQLAKSGRAVPIPSARREASIESSVRAASLDVDDALVAELESAFGSLPP